MASKLKSNLFQKVLLALIAVLAAFGIGLINYAMKLQPDEVWLAVTAMFTWLGTIVLLVISGQIEDIRKRNE